LAGVHDRQAVHHKNPETRYKLMAPGGTEVHRQAVPHGTQKIQYNNMCRLAAMNSPPGGFWKFPRNPKLIQFTKLYLQ